MKKYQFLINNQPHDIDYFFYRYLEHVKTDPTLSGLLINRKVVFEYAPWQPGSHTITFEIAEVSK